MAKFDVTKKGYDVEQVDNFINKLSVRYEEKLSEQKDRVFSLKNELAVMEERLKSYRDKDKQISQALMYAVEKAEEVESNASKLYDLEIKRLKLLYKKWADVATLLSTIEMPNDVKMQVVDLSKTIAQVLEQNNKIGVNMIRKDLHKNSDNYIKNLLNKMDYAINSKPKQAPRQVLSSMSAETEKENARIIDLSGKLDKIKATGKGSMADNYLNSEEDLSSPFASTLVKGKSKHKKSESGFDLEDALNPKEDLDEIMRAFDFFIDENDEK